MDNHIPETLSGRLTAIEIAISGVVQGVGSDRLSTWLQISSAFKGRSSTIAEPEIHCLRDPTRGGLAATLNELAHQSGLGMIIDEHAIPIRPAVRGACELLGIDPLGVANEGKLIAFCPPEKAEALVATMRDQPFGENAAVIGHAKPDPRRLVWLQTSFGGDRVVEWFNGEQLPRIC